MDVATTPKPPEVAAPEPMGVIAAPRLGAPAFSWPAFVATERSAMVASSVSPLR